MWILMYRTINKRVRLSDGKLTPAFKYPKQAFKFKEKYYSNNSHIIMQEVGIHA